MGSTIKPLGAAAPILLGIRLHLANGTKGACLFIGRQKGTAHVIRSAQQLGLPLQVIST